MKNHRFRRILSLILVAALLAGFYVPGAQAASTGLSWKETDREIKPDMSDRIAETQVEEKYRPSDIVRVSIILEDKPTIQAGYSTRNIVGNAEAMAYSSQLKSKQDALAAAISAQALGGKKLDVVWNLTLAANLISARVPYGSMDAIAKVAGVKTVVLENTYLPCVIEREETVAEPQMFASLGMTGSSLVWSSGFTGAGSRIAVLDTGTDTNHQSLDSGAFLYALEQNAKAAGVSFEEYVSSLDLLDAQEIATVLPYLNFKKLFPAVTADQLYLSEKLPFAANYIDKNLVVDHESDGQGEHGSHVAGIATANRFIPKDGGYVDALNTVMMAGIAPDAQLITMKVFGRNGGPTDSDYMAAIEDAIYLGCDSVNLSLGSSVSDFAFNDEYAAFLEYMTQTDTVVVASAGNSYSWPETTMFGRPYTGDVALDTVGSPGSYGSFFTVASVENDGGIGLIFRVDDRPFGYQDGSNGSNASLAKLDVSDDLSGTTYEYVFVDGLGDAADYEGMDLNGKVVFCSRGVTNFSVKAQTAVNLGAAATIVYNNQSGLFGMDLSGYSYTNPCASISQADADAIRGSSTVQTTSGGTTYYTGKITIIGKETGFLANSEYYTMSQFSSWGVPGDLSLKPEITAPGGNIYSLFGQTPTYGGGPDQYELMSGTSMAAPAITGMAALMAQYIRESGLAEAEDLHVRTLAQSLLMSTAVPIMEADSGCYYSLMKQGAGLARPDLAVSADSYILVDGQPDGKVKAELGDDPNRTGVYEFSFSINNLTDEDLSYAFRADVFRQDAYDPGLVGGGQAYGFTVMDLITTYLPATADFYVNGAKVEQGKDLSDYDLNGDGTTDAPDADYLLEYLLGNETVIHGQADVNADGTVNTYDAHVLLTSLNSTDSVTVPAGESLDVSVTLSLTQSAKAALDEMFENGTFVEAFVYAESLSDAEGTTGTCHSIPMLAFYGNWSDPNMFDYGTVAELMHLFKGMVPYMYQVINTGSANSLTIDYGDGGEYYFGGNPFVQDDEYLAERNAFNSEDASRLYGQYFTLLRNASDMQMVITNAATEELYYQKAVGQALPAYYFVNGGTWQNVQQGFFVGWTGTDAKGNPIPENTLVDVTLIAAPEYYRNADGTHNYDELGRGANLSTQFYIDNTAPEVTDMELVDSTLTVSGVDNRHVAAVVLMNGAGTSLISAETPNQTELNVPVSVDLDLTNVMGKSFLLAIYDYASNVTVYEIELDLPEIQRPYLTAVDSQTNTYYGIDLNGTSMELAVSDRGTIHAAEFVDGYVFEVVNAEHLYVASNDDLNNFSYLCSLDPDGLYGITTFLDLAYNYADGNLYGLFYCEANGEATSVLCTIDMYSGEMAIMGEMPVDVNNLAIDGEGNFYSVSYGAPSLYTYTLEDLANGTMNYVGEVGYYGTDYANSLAWDHNTDTLFWAFPNTLLTVNTETAEPTLLDYNTYIMVGLFITPETYGNRFAPTDEVVGVTLDHTENRTLVGNTITLTAQVWPWNVSDDSVTWSSSNTAVATVNENGTVTGVAPGTAVITATSKLDPSKSATCTFVIEKLEKTLNSIVWDDMGDIWWAEFNTADLPNYTKLSTVPAEDYVTSTAIMPDGTLYASTIDLSTGYIESLVYTVDPDTFEMTYVGASSAGYTDIAPAPHIHGGALAAVYAGYVLFVNTDTGDFYAGQSDIFHMFYNNLIGIAYAGSTYYNEYGFDNYIDWYFIADTEGYIYYMGFIEGPDGKLYYLEHPDSTSGIYTVLNAKSDTPYFSSLYFDGEFLYFSCYNEQKDNNTLYAIDTMGNHKAYELGNFGAGVWPVSGLMELADAASINQLNIDVTAEPKAVEHAELSKLAATASKKTAEPVSDGGLNSIIPAASGEYDEQDEQVVLDLTGVNTAPNGRMTVEYDPAVLTLTGVTGYTTAFAYTVENGKITVAFAETAELAQDTVIASLYFEPVKSGETTVTVTHAEAWNEPSGKQEFVTVEIPGQQTEDPYLVDWQAATTSLNGTIDLNVYVHLGEALANSSETFVRFSYAGKTVDVPIADAIITEEDGIIQHRFSLPMYAKQVVDTVTFQVMQGEDIYGLPREYSITTYCMNRINKSTNPAQVALCKALLNYASAAQLAFNYKTDTLANARLDAADKVLPQNIDVSGYAASVTGSETGIKVDGATLMLESAVSIRVYFLLEEGYDISDFTFTIDGKVVEPQKNSSGWFIETDGISAKNLDQMMKFSVGGLTVNYGPMSYVNSKLKASSTNEATLNLVKALYAYYQAAEALLG